MIEAASTAEAPVRSRRTLLLFAAIGLFVGLVRVESLADPNVLWETRDGLTILSSGHLPHSDAWSWTIAGRHWVPNSWGWDVVLGAAYRLAGAAGLVLLNLVLVIALFAGMSSVAARRGATARTALLSVGALGGVIMMPWVIVRPQLATYLFVLAVVPAMRQLLVSSGRRYAAWLAVVAVGQLLWINLHFAGVLGPVLLAAAGLGELLGRRFTQLAWRVEAMRVAGGVVVAAAVCAATPYGPAAVSKTLAVHSDVAGLIVEWRPAGFGSYSQFTALLAIGAGLVAAAAAARAARWGEVAVVAVLAAGAAGACRIAPMLAVLALPEVAAFLAVRPVRGWTMRIGYVVGAVILVLGIGIAATQVSQFGKLKRASNSAALIERLPRGCRVVNDYKLGGALIMFRPDVRVSVDSRTDLYGRAGILRNQGLLADDLPNTAALLMRARVSCVLAPSSSALVRRLRSENGWRLEAADATRSLLVRQPVGA